MKNYIVLCLLIILFVSCKAKKVNDQTPSPSIGSVKLVITAKSGTNNLIIGNQYISPKGERYKVNKLKFFVTDIGLSKSDASENPAIASEGNGTYLVNFNHPNTTDGSYAIDFTAKTGDYYDIRFNIGLPRDLNHGDPTIAPAPLDLSQEDMYWSWNSGYIFLLAEGSGPDVNGNLFHFGIGSDTRLMSYSFGNLLNPVPKFTVEENKTTQINLELDFNKLLKNTNDSLYSFSDYNACNVHGGYYADVLKANASNIMSFKSAQIIQ